MIMDGILIITFQNAFLTIKYFNGKIVIKENPHIFNKKFLLVDLKKLKYVLISIIQTCITYLVALQH